MLSRLLSRTSIVSFEVLRLTQQITATTVTTTHMSTATPPPDTEIAKIVEVGSTAELLAPVVVAPVCDNKTCLLSTIEVFNKTYVLCVCFSLSTFIFVRCAKHTYILTVLAVVISWSVMSAI